MNLKSIDKLITVMFLSATPILFIELIGKNYIFNYLKFVVIPYSFVVLIITIYSTVNEYKK